MKRVIPIFFLLIFLFNTGGYYLVFWCIKHQAKEDLLARLHASNYSREESIILTIPFPLPYTVSDGSYQPVHGDFEYGGEYYKLAQQKLVNDTLFIICVRDKETKHIENTLSDYSRLANNLPVGTKQASNFLSKIFKDYHSDNRFTMAAWSNPALPQYFVLLTASVIEHNYTIDTPPPQFHC